MAESGCQICFVHLPPAQFGPHQRRFHLWHQSPDWKCRQCSYASPRFRDALAHAYLEGHRLQDNSPVTTSTRNSGSAELVKESQPRLDPVNPPEVKADARQATSVTGDLFRKSEESDSAQAQSSEKPSEETANQSILCIGHVNPFRGTPSPTIAENIVKPELELPVSTAPLQKSFKKPKKHTSGRKKTNSLHPQAPSDGENTAVMELSAVNKEEVEEMAALETSADPIPSPKVKADASETENATASLQDALVTASSPPKMRILEDWDRSPGKKQAAFPAQNTENPGVKLKCQKCRSTCKASKAYNKSRIALAHVRACYGIRPYACSACGYRSSEKNSAKGHIAGHCEGAEIVTVEVERNEAAIRDALKRSFPNLDCIIRKLM